MPDYRDHHATIFLPPEIAGPIEAARHEWDPNMASRIAAHVTLAYPQEAPNAKLLFERVREASDSIGSFRLRLGGVACFERRPEYGVYVEVEDIDGGYRKMREHVLRPPFRCLTFPAHVTLVHPQTSRRGRGFCERGAYQRQSQEFTAREIAVTAFDGVRWTTLETYELVCREDDPGDRWTGTVQLHTATDRGSRCSPRPLSGRVGRMRSQDESR